MSLVMMNAYKPTLIDQERTFLNTLKIRPFYLPTSLTGGENLGSFSFPTFDGGYSEQSPVFSAATLNGGNEGQLLAPNLEWVFDHAGGDFDVYGIVYVDPGNSDAPVMAELLSAPLTVDRPGVLLRITPRKVMDDL